VEPVTLSARLLRGLIDGLGDLYSPVTSTHYPARVVRVVTSLLSCDSCSYHHFGPTGLLAWHVEPGEVGAFPGTAALFLSDRQVRSLGLDRDLYRHTGTCCQVAITVPGPRGGFIAVAVNRQHGDFTDDEAELFGLLRPHIGHAAAICHLLDESVSGTACSLQDYPLITSRQARVLQLVAAGYSDRAIARALGISTRTVNAHLRNIYRTLDVTSRTEALARIGVARRSW
jgi:DNA-binding CsgD family transcriptional regulator